MDQVDEHECRKRHSEAGLAHATTGGNGANDDDNDFQQNLDQEPCPPRKQHHMTHSWRYTKYRPLRKEPARLICISNGSHDPFDASAVSINEFNSELAPLWGPQYLFTFRDPLALERPDVDPMWCWMRILIDDEGAMHAAYTAAYHMGTLIAPGRAKDNDYQRKERKHYGKALALLRKNSWTSATIPSAIHATIALCAFTFMAGDVDSCRIHYRGLIHLIEKAGGVKALGQTLRNVLLHGLAAAVCLLFEQCPVDLDDFNCFAWHKDESVTAIRDALPLSLLHSSTPILHHLPFPSNLLMRDDVRESIWSAVHSCREVLLVQAQVCQLPRGKLRVSQPIRAWMETRFAILSLKLTNLACKFSQEKEQLWACLCLALRCCKGLIYHCRQDPRHMTIVPTHHLNIHLERLLLSSSSLYKQLYADIFLWITFVAARGEHQAATRSGKEAKWFSKHFITMAEDMDRTAIKSKLRQLLYDEEILDPFLESLLERR